MEVVVVVSGLEARKDDGELELTERDDVGCGAGRESSLPVVGTRYGKLMGKIRQE